MSDTSIFTDRGEFHPSGSRETYEDLACLLSDPRRLPRLRDTSTEFGYEAMHRWQARNVQDWLGERDHQLLALTLEHLEKALRATDLTPEQRREVRNRLVSGHPDGIDATMTVDAYLKRTGG